MREVRRRPGRGSVGEEGGGARIANAVHGGLVAAREVGRRPRWRGERGRRRPGEGRGRRMGRWSGGRWRKPWDEGEKRRR